MFCGEVRQARTVSRTRASGTRLVRRRAEPVQRRTRAPVTLSHLRARLQHVLETHRRVRQRRLQRVDHTTRVVGLLVGSALLAPQLLLVGLQLGKLGAELGDVRFDYQRQLIDLPRLARLLKERSRLGELRQLAQLVCGGDAEDR